MPVSAKREGKQQKKLVSTATVSGTVYCAYLILPFGDCRVHIFFENLSRNIFIGSYRRANYFVPYCRRPQSDSTVGGLLRREILRRLVRLDVLQVCSLA